MAQHEAARRSGSSRRPNLYTYLLFVLGAEFKLIVKKRKQKPMSIIYIFKYSFFKLQIPHNVECFTFRDFHSLLLQQYTTIIFKYIVGSVS